MNIKFRVTILKGMPLVSSAGNLLIQVFVTEVLNRNLQFPYNCASMGPFIGHNSQVQKGWAGQFLFMGALCGLLNKIMFLLSYSSCSA